MGPKGNEDTGGNGVQGYRAHGQLDPQGQRATWPIRPTGGMGYRGYGAHGQ